MKESRIVLFARVSERAGQWITEQSQKQGLSKNDIVQMLINNAIKNEIQDKPTDT